MCDCISNSEKALSELFQKQTGTSDENIRAEYDNKTVIFNPLSIQFYGNVEASYKIGKRIKKWKTYIKFSFCPLCGEKYQ
jgi:hypothetical protein